MIFGSFWLQGCIMWLSSLPLVTLIIDLPGPGHTLNFSIMTTWIIYLLQTLASPPFLWYSFPSQSANTLCLHLGLIFTQESFNFEMTNYNIYFLSTTIWHSIFLPEFPQNTDPLSSSGAWLQTSFSVSQPFLSSLPSHGIEVLWYVYLFGHILGNILGSPSPPVAAIWQNHSPGEIQTFVSYLYLDSRSCWRK